MITKYVKASILDTELLYIAHGVNCQNTMGSGVAKVLFTAHPEIKNEYHRFCLWNLKHEGIGARLLGQVHEVAIEINNKWCFNLFTQEHYGYNGNRYVNYKAVVDCFKALSQYDLKGPIAIPKIGCGLAGGNWNFMEQLINDTVGDTLEIWVYEPETKTSKRNDCA